MLENDVIITAFIALNAIMFALTGIDKRRAKRKEFRISEKIILLGGALGGAGGVLSAMVMFRHKTQKKIFRIGMPILFFMNLIGAYFLLLR